MPFWRLFYHVVFATRGRHTLPTDGLRTEARRLLWSKAEALGCIVHAVAVQPDHVHLALSIPPSKAIGQVVGQIKGSSSHGMSSLLPPTHTFSWQESYGVFSVGERNLPHVVRYLDDQDQRHATGKLWPMLEQTESASSKESRS